MQESKKFERLEAVRGAAAVYVCITHIWGNHMDGILRHLFSFGQEAVIVFFVLSGFVIGWSVNAGQKAFFFKQYFNKRFTRIYSVWLLSSVFLALIILFGSNNYEWPSVIQVLGNMFMLQDFSVGKPAVLVEPILGNSPLWSLHYEWWFYMFFPVVLFFGDLKKRTHIVGIVSVVSSALYVIYPNFLLRLLFYFSVWWIGVYAAEIMRRDGKICLRDLILPMAYVFVSAVPLVLLCLVECQNGTRMVLGIHPVLEARHMLASIALVVSAFIWRQFRWIGFTPTLRIFAVVAPISYSLYITHYVSIHKADYLSFLPGSIAVFLYTLITVVFCWFAECKFYPWFKKWFS